MSREVSLHIYDISHGVAGPLGPALLGMPLPYGIPHTGVVVEGWEYFFGGGIQKQRPAAVTQSTGLRPVASLLLGRTARSDADIAQHLRALSAKFSASTYDLFANNCNHFSHALAQYLLDGVGLPDDIVRLPERVRASGPMGAQISQMWGSMQQQFNGGSGGGADPFAGAFGGGSGGGSGGSGSAARPISATLPPPPPPPRTSALPPLCTYPDAAGAELVGARLRACAAAGAGAGLALSEEEGALLSGLGGALAAPEPAPWAPTACALAARVLAAWPPATASFPGALLARLVALRSDCCSALVGQGGAAGLLLERLAASPAGWGLASTNNQALQALANATAGAAGAAWATLHEGAAPALAALLARELRNPTRADCRAIALGVAGNVVRAWGGVPAAKGEAEAAAHAQRGGLALLCGLLQGVEEEGEGGAGAAAAAGGGANAGGAAARRLQCAAGLLRARAFAGGDLGALALSMEAGAGLAGMAGDGSGRWSAETRRDAQAVLELLAQG